MYLLEMENIIKKFGKVKALDGVSIRLKAGECCGLCGENGSGKSTLMKVLSAVWPYGTWEGKITFEGKELKATTISETEEAGIVIIHQELMLSPYLSVAENIFMGREPKTKLGLIDFDKMNQESSKLLESLGVSSINPADPVMNYGGGYQQLIEIAKALSKNAKLIIFDEPSSSLTSSEIKRLLEIIKGLKNKGIACVYISHKIDEVSEISNFVTVIRDGKHIGDRVNDGSLSIDDIVTMMVGREMSKMFDKKKHDIGDVIFEAKNIICHNVTNPELLSVDNVSFKLKSGEILGISGLVGAGRTEALQAVFGSYSGKYSCEVYLEGEKLNIKQPIDSVKHKIAMVPEDRKSQGIVPILSVGDNITKSTLTDYSDSYYVANVVNDAMENKVINDSIDKLRVKTESPFLEIGGLSGGNQQKAVIAKMLLVKPKVLILDEPTRGIDVGAKAEIYKLIFDIVQSGTSIIIVSSELPEVLGLSDRVLVFGEGKLKAEFKNDGSLNQEIIMAKAIS